MPVWELNWDGVNNAGASDAAGNADAESWAEANTPDWTEDTNNSALPPFCRLGAANIATIPGGRNQLVNVSFNFTGSGGRETKTLHHSLPNFSRAQTGRPGSIILSSKPKSLAPLARVTIEYVIDIHYTEDADSNGYIASITPIGSLFWSTNLQYFVVYAPDGIIFE